MKIIWENRIVIALLCLLNIMAPEIYSRETREIQIPLLPGERIWSGAIKEGNNMPFEVGYRYDFYANNQNNQIQPLLLGSKGLWVWSEEPFAFEVAAGKLIITHSSGEIKSGHAGSSLAEGMPSAIF